MKLLSVILFGLVACVLYGVGAGLRGDIGILLNPLAAHSGLGYADVSVCIAVMQLVFGATQPGFGILAARKSNRFVLALGAGALSFGLILTSAVNFVGRRNAMVISGMLNAAAGMVGFVLSPVLQGLLSAHGLVFTLVAMASLAAALLPVILFVTSRDRAAMEAASAEPEPLGWGVFREAFANRTFRLLFASAMSFCIKEPNRGTAP